MSAEMYCYIYVPLQPNQNIDDTVKVLEEVNEKADFFDEKFLHLNCKSISSTFTTKALENIKHN